MKILKLIFTFMLWTAFAGLVNCGTVLADQEKVSKELPIVQKWSGDYAVAELGRLPESLRTSPMGYLDDQNTFADVWQVFKPGEKMPEVNFKIHLVIFVRNVDFYNRISIGMVKLTGGILEIMAMETMSAMPIEDKAAMALAIIPRAGVKFIQAGKKSIPVPDVSVQ